MINLKRVIAIDPSLTQSGWAVFDVHRQNATAWGVISSMPASIPLVDRLNDLQSKISKLFSDMGLSSNDFLVCEGPAPISLNPSSSIKVEQVRGIFETLARCNGVKVLSRLNPRTVQNEILGLKGKQLPRQEVKQVARQVLLQLYADRKSEFMNLQQDVIDALLIGTLAQSRISQSLKLGIDPVVFFSQSNISKGKKRGRGLSWPSYMG